MPPIASITPSIGGPLVQLMIDGMPPVLEVISWDYDIDAGRRTLRVRFYA